MAGTVMPTPICTTDGDDPVQSDSPVQIKCCFDFSMNGKRSRIPPVCVCLLLQDLLQSCSRGGRRRVEDMCYERRQAEACVDESAHHALVNAGGREIV
jgi:hypothetical protein